MAQLTFISETGMFHSACSCAWGSTTEWLGFKPMHHLSPMGPAIVDRSDRSRLINHSVTFEIADALLRAAMPSVVHKYVGRTYVLGVRDCVSFTADLARAVRLHVPAVNLTPYGLIQALAIWNSYQSKR